MNPFRHALPRFQEEGKYGFVERLQLGSALFAAPFDFRLLRRWTTCVALAETAVAALSDRPFLAGKCAGSSAHTSWLAAAASLVWGGRQKARTAGTETSGLP